MRRPGTAETVLLAGGAGFLGAHLCRALLERGDSVVCVDNFSTGAPERIDEFRDNPRFSLVVHDVTDAIEVPASIPIDRIYNLACPASPVHYRKQPIATARANLLGTMNLLALAVERNVPILLASTSEIYGDPAVHPQNEEYRGNVDPVGPRAPYTEGKRAAETLMATYHRERGVPVRIARIFNTYGPGVAIDDGRVISTFIVQALRGDPITVHGDGVQTRSFCYVDDLVVGLVAMMDRPEAIVGPLNLGCPEEVTIGDLAERVRDATGSRSEIVYRDGDADDPTRRNPDITRARTELGWEPTIPLREGIARTAAWIADELGAIGYGPRGGRR